MQNIAPGSEYDLWWNWAVAELDSDRWSETYRLRIPADVREKLVADLRDDLSNREWEKVKEGVLQVRFPILADLVGLGTRWHTGELDQSELPSLRVMNYDPHVALAPTRTLEEFSAALDAGRDPPGEERFGSNYRTVRGAFDLGRARGRPILVAERPEGPYTMLEGYTRLAALCSLRRSGRVVTESISVLLGVCPRLSEWRMWVPWQGQAVRTDKRLY